jgi:methylmalonyl-CoA mutase
VREFQQVHSGEAQRQLDLLKEAATTGANVFDALMDAVRHCSLGQITEAFFEVGGQYRRNV